MILRIALAKLQCLAFGHPRPNRHPVLAAYGFWCQRCGARARW